jgi:branched-chain amino acid transport system substrate-binding protein
MKRLFIFLAVSILFFSVSCASKQQTIRIGVIAELTGDIPAVGASCKNASEMFVKEINDAGGIEIAGKKYKIDLFIEDCAGKAELAASSAQKLITQNKIVAIIGPNASRYAIPASEIAESSKVVLITPWSTNPKTTLDAKTNLPKKYVFRSCFIDPFQGKVVAKFALDNLKTKKAAILYDVASEYNKGIAEFFKSTYEANGGKVTAFETYTTNDKDFSAQLTKIKKTDPEVIFLPNYYSEVPLQVQQAHRLGINVPFLGSDSWGSSELLKLAGKEMEGFYFSTHYAADAATPAAVKFIDNYNKTYNTKPDDVAALTYDAFGLLVTAIRSANKIDREAVRAEMAKILNYDGVTGTMQFKEGSGDPIKSAVILQIKGDKFAWFTNANP